MMHRGLFAFLSSRFLPAMGETLEKACAPGRSAMRQHGKLGIRALAALIALLCFGAEVLGSAAGVGAQTQSPTWSVPIPLSNIASSSWFPDITADATGRLHVVWASTVERKPPPGTPLGTERPTSYDVVEYTSSLDGTDWAEPNEIIAFRQVNGGSIATRPSLLADPNGTLHLAMVNFDVQYSRARIDRASDAGSWTTPVKISTNGDGYYSSLARDSQGIVHIAFTQNLASLNCAICYHVLVRSSADGGANWSNLTDVSVLPQGAAKPKQLVDDAGGLHLVWEAGQGGGLGQVQDPTSVMHASSVDGGKIWMLPYQFPSPGGRARNISIGMDGDGRLIVVWLGLPSQQIYTSISEDNGLSWSSPFPIEGIVGYDTRLDDTTVATDSAGNIHLVTVGWVDAEQTQLGLFHAVWHADTSTWSSPDIVVSYSGDAPEWPRLAISEGNKLNVVWFVRDAAHIFDSENGRYQIWFAQATVEAPSVPARNLPTPTVTPNLLPPTDEPRISTPTAAPDLAGTNLTLALKPVDNENSVLLIVAKSLVIPIALLILALAYIRYRH
ncbi:MAG: sialidase family protein [Anaerolineales bacterium]